MLNAGWARVPLLLSLLGAFAACNDTGGVDPTLGIGTDSPTENVDDPTPTPTATSTVTFSPTDTPTPTAAPTPTPTAEPTPTATSTPTAVPTPTPTADPTPTPTAEPTPTATSTPTAVPTPTPTAAPTPTPTAEPTPTATSTPTAAPTPTPTAAPTPTPTAVPTPTPTAVPTPTPTPTPTAITDNDGDGFGLDVDCDDSEPNTYPSADELCDNEDNDCDEAVDEGLPGTTTVYADSDGDGLGDIDAPLSTCLPPDGYVDNSFDCDDNDSSIGIGEDATCPALSCEQALTLGSLSESGPLWIQPAGEAVEVYCDLDSSDVAIGMVEADINARLTWSEIQDSCPSGLIPFRYVNGDYVTAAIAYTGSFDYEGYYLLNSIAGPETTCPTLADESGYFRSNDAWLDDGLSLEDWGMDISANCNLSLTDKDPIPLLAGVGPRTTTGTNVLHLSSENGSTFPVLCMESYDRDGDGQGHMDDCDDQDPLTYLGAAELADGQDNDCDSLADEGLSLKSCKDAIERHPDAPSGPYTLDPDGPEGAIPPLRTYCDMESDGGGWTLVSQGIPVENPALNLCNAGAIGTLNLDGLTVTAPAKLADTTVNALWSEDRELLIKNNGVEETQPQERDEWDRACIVDFAPDFQWASGLRSDYGMEALDSVDVSCLIDTWGDEEINEVYGERGLFCGYSFTDTSTGAAGSTSAFYLIYSAITSYSGGTCTTASAGRSWMGIGNWGCQVTQHFIR